MRRCKQHVSEKWNDKLDNMWGIKWYVLGKMLYEGQRTTIDGDVNDIKNPGEVGIVQSLREINR